MATLQTIYSAYTQGYTQSALQEMVLEYINQMQYNHLPMAYIDALNASSNYRDFMYQAMTNRNFFRS